MKRTAFYDEAIFFLNSTVSTQNCPYWADENPHWNMETVNMCPEVVTNSILAPFLTDITLTGDYLTIYQST